MDHLTRRDFLRQHAQAAAGLLAAGALGTAAFGAEAAPAAPAATRVPMEVPYQPCFLSWVSAAAACLNALGTKCDLADVAGHSGYAFLLTVTPGVDVSGPTSVDFLLLASGLPRLGRSVLTFTGATCVKGTSDDFRFAHELVAREIAAGRPCVLWGVDQPEFGVVTGVGEKGYAVIGPSGRPDTVALDKLAACVGVHVVAFPTKAGRTGVEPDRAAVGHALRCLRYQPDDPGRTNGLAAYDVWIAALRKGGLDPFGHSYNVKCWSAAKGLAHTFIARLAGRNAAVKAPLAEAAKAYAEAAGEMQTVADLFPFPDLEKRILDAEARAQAVDALRSAKAAEERAAKHLEEAARAWPPEVPGMRGSAQSMRAPCGLDCAQCDVLARGECAGCRGDRAKQWSDNCGIRACCTDTKHLTLCNQCPEFACKQLKDWAAAYRHHGTALQWLEANKRG